MGQVQIEENIYFQQMGEEVIGVYVNAQFISIKVDRELNDEQLEELGAKILSFCKCFEPINNIIENYRQMYIENSNWDLGF